MKNEYLTVQEFAKIAGVSVQSVYKRLNNSLNPFIKLVNNQKMLNSKALTEIYGVDVEQLNQPKINNQLNLDVTSFLNLIEKQNEQLKNELYIKNSQIKELNNRLEEVTMLCKQQQALNANAEKKILVLEESKEEPLNRADELELLLNERNNTLSECRELLAEKENEINKLSAKRKWWKRKIKYYLEN